MKPILYLDIEDTLITPDRQREKLRPRAEALIEWSLACMDTKWLTGLEQASIEDVLYPLVPKIDLRSIERVEWQRLKTDAIDWEREFWRLDDHMEAEEWSVLEDRGAADRVVVVDALEENGLIEAWRELLRRIQARVG